MAQPSDYQGVAWNDLTILERRFIRELAATGEYDQFHTERTTETLYITFWSAGLKHYLLCAVVPRFTSQAYSQVKAAVLAHIVERKAREYQHLIDEAILPEDAQAHVDSLYTMIGIVCPASQTDKPALVRYRSDKAFGVALSTLPERRMTDE